MGGLQEKILQVSMELRVWGHSGRQDGLTVTAGDLPSLGLCQPGQFTGSQHPESQLPLLAVCLSR